LAPTAPGIGEKIVMDEFPEFGIVSRRTVETDASGKKFVTFFANYAMNGETNELSVKYEMASTESVDSMMLDTLKAPPPEPRAAWNPMTPDSTASLSDLQPFLDQPLKKSRNHAMRDE